MAHSIASMASLFVKGIWYDQRSRSGGLPAPNSHCLSVAQSAARPQSNICPKGDYTGTLGLYSFHNVIDTHNERTITFQGVCGSDKWPPQSIIAANSISRKALFYVSAKKANSFDHM